MADWLDAYPVVPTEKGSAPSQPTQAAQPTASWLDAYPTVAPSPKGQTWNSAAGSLASGINRDLANVAGMPMDAWAGLENAAIRGVNNVAGTQFPQQRAIGGSDDIHKLLTSLVGKTEPQTQLDKNLYATGEGVGSTVATMGTGAALKGAGLLPKVANMLTPESVAGLLKGVGYGALAGEGAYQGGPVGKAAVAQFTDNPAAQQAGETVGHVVGGALPGAAVKGGVNLAGRGLNHAVEAVPAGILDMAAKYFPAVTNTAAGHLLGPFGIAIGAPAGRIGSRYLSDKADELRARAGSPQIQPAQATGSLRFSGNQTNPTPQEIQAYINQVAGNVPTGLARATPSEASPYLQSLIGMLMGDR